MDCHNCKIHPKSILGKDIEKHWPNAKGRMMTNHFIISSIIDVCGNLPVMEIGK